MLSIFYLQIFLQFSNKHITFLSILQLYIMAMVSNLQNFMCKAKMVHPRHCPSEEKTWSQYQKGSRGHRVKPAISSLNTSTDKQLTTHHILKEDFHTLASHTNDRIWLLVLVFLSLELEILSRILLNTSCRCLDNTNKLQLHPMWILLVDSSFHFEKNVNFKKKSLNSGLRGFCFR